MNSKKHWAGKVYFLFMLILPIFAKSQTTSSLIPKKGLFITTNHLTWASGSEINFFTPDRKQHHYYFTWWEQDTASTPQGRNVLLIGSKNTAVYGTYSLRHSNNASELFIACNWNSDELAMADIIHTKIWLPFFEEAKWTNSQQKEISDFASFDDTLLIATAPFGTFYFHSSHRFKLKQDNNSQPGAKDYGRRSQFLMLYEESILVNKETGLNRDFTITCLQTIPETKQTEVIKKEQLQHTVAAWTPDIKDNLLLPKPKSVQLKKAFYLIPNSRPAIVPGVVSQFRQWLQLYWQTGNQYYPRILPATDNTLSDEGYTLEILPQQINLRYKTAKGLQYALQSLVQLTKNENGKLIIPQGAIKDEPAISWRGIHMFTGPTSLKFHKRMYNRVLFPLKMNNVVLQCEQAEWKSQPQVHNSISVPLKDLKAEFDYLRRNNVEPIPLIQSLGHMEWFFKPKQNRFMAVNPQYPYTLNPYLQQSEKAVKQLWDEAFTLLKPKIMHIGFDEIGMIGFNIPREREIDYFKTQITFLHNYARRKKAKLMLWGDMGLAPGEGPDALNGVTKKRAALIRSFIPPGSYVADWHYINDPNPGIYKKNLELWKQNKDVPLASPWLRPDNIKGFVQAAIDENAGVLQTTWADFESSEKNMLLNIEQFGAYTLAMDYAWSGRKELPKDLPYNAVEEWVSRFYSQARPVAGKNGWIVPTAIQLNNITAAAEAALPANHELKFDAVMAEGLKLKGSTEVILAEATPVALIQLYNGNKVVYEKELRYGVDVRGKFDQRFIYAHIPGKDEKTLYDFFQKRLPITSIRIQNLHPASGLKIEELVLIE